MEELKNNVAPAEAGERELLVNLLCQNEVFTSNVCGEDRWLAGEIVDMITRALRAQPPAREDAQPVALPTDEGGCVTKRFVIFTKPGEVPEKKGGWLKDEHLIDFLRDVMLHDGWKPGFRATVLELTWDNDLWASSATEYLSMHDHAIGPRRARKAWQEAREKHERIYKTSPKMKLGDEIDSYRKATAITHPAPDALRVAVEALGDLIENAVVARGCGLRDDPDGIVSSALFDTIMNARAALAAMQASLKEPTQ